MAESCPERPMDKIAVLVSLDFFAGPVVGELSKVFSEVLVIVSGKGVSGADLSQKSSPGISVLVTNSSVLANAALAAFCPRLVVAVGPPSLSNVPYNVLLDAGERPRNLPESCGYPAWPEFGPIWHGCEESFLQLVANNQEPLVSTAVTLSELDTAISLRYKHVKAIPALFKAATEQGIFSRDWNANAAVVQSADMDLPTATESLYLDQTTFGLADADRFIRAATFPPNEPPLVRTLDGDTDYYIDSLAHYIHFLEKTGSSGSAHVASSTDCQARKEYTADTHWYSNVGGTIVKVQAETLELRAKSNLSQQQFIPGQALSKTAKKRLRMNEPLIGLTALHYVQSALNSGWIGVEGPHIKKFEASLARICGVQSACAVQSGTAALYGAMKALGVCSSSHYVIVPTYTCAACADAIVHAGGVPVPVDCELDSYGLDFDSVADALQKNTAIVGVVLAPCYGVPSRDHVRIWKLCKNQGLWLCEDNCESYGAYMTISEENTPKASSAYVSAHSFGAGPSGTPAAADARLAAVGSLSTMSVVSVRSEKMVGVGEGGAIMSNDGALVSKARWWCSRAPVRGCGLWRVYEHEEIGQNFRLPELLGAVGLAACENLPVMIANKRAIHDWYASRLGDLDYLALQQPKNGDRPVWWLNSLRFDVDSIRPEIKTAICAKQKRDKHYNLAEDIGMRLMKQCPHIEIRPAFFPLHKMPCFATHAPPCPNADQVYDTLLCVPSSAQLTEVDVDEVCLALRNSIDETLAALLA